MRKYTASAGQTWDFVAVLFYYTEFAMNILLEANPDYSDILVFKGGEELNIPYAEFFDETALPPWRR